MMIDEFEDILPNVHKGDDDIINYSVKETNLITYLIYYTKTLDTKAETIKITFVILRDYLKCSHKWH